MCKYYFVLTVFLLSGIQLLSQEKWVDGTKAKPKLEIGYLDLYNNLNTDNYFKFKYSYSTDNGKANIGGLSLKINIPTKHEYLDIIVGSVFMKGFDEIDFGYVNPSSVNAHDYIINGGGVYFGISPKLKGKFIGLTSDFGLGVFSFKEYVSIVNNKIEPFVDEHNQKASYGLGAISSIGMYINIGKVGLSPSFVSIFSGGSETSFTFYGFNFLLSWQF